MGMNKRALSHGGFCEMGASKSAHQHIVLFTEAVGLNFHVCLTIKDCPALHILCHVVVPQAWIDTVDLIPVLENRDWL
jgi:hypothetical protein